MSPQNTAWPLRTALPPSRTGKRLFEVLDSPTWLANSLLILASGVLLTLACTSAWLSYHAQVAYVLAHNGNQSTEAKIWALLLDAGTAGVSMLRLYETLRRRPSLATRISLAGCVTASVTMNFLHAPARSAGDYLVAAVPPVMYAVFLEHLLTNLRGLLMAGEERSSSWRVLALWVNFPGLMWSGWRNSLRRLAEEASSVLESVSRTDETAQQAASGDGGREAERAELAINQPEAGQPVYPSRRGRRPGAKRIAFEAALVGQVRRGDLRLFSEDERERNAAAYEAAASLLSPLSHGAARRYVVQAVERVRDAADAADPSATAGVAEPEMFADS